VKRLLVIEDGGEYAEFARLFMASRFEVSVAHSASQALELIGEQGADALLIDLRFDRAPPTTLVGDVAATAARLFSGDAGRALRYLQDQQGTLILGTLRAAGHTQPAVFVHDFPQRRLENLQKMYGAVHAVESFDAAAIMRALGAAE
jgi:hypothetical protein